MPSDQPGLYTFSSGIHTALATNKAENKETKYVSFDRIYGEHHIWYEYISAITTAATPC